jgi:glucokinase
MLAGIDIGGTKTRIAIANNPSDIIEDIVIPTPKDQNEALKTYYENLIELADEKKILSLGIASPAIIDKDRGSIIKPSHIPWSYLPISTFFKNKLGCLATIDHDATLAGIAEAKLGAGANHRLVLYVTISTGIGTAIILDGEPITQRYNSEGGRQIIHNHPFPGVQYQKIASGSAIKAKYHKIAAEITSKKDWDEIAKNISTGLYNLITIIQPDLIILGGGVSVHYNHFITPLRTYLDKFNSLYPIPPIKKAEYVETAPLIGALLMAQSALTLPNEKN